ncbi:MAG: hypothetical protein M3Q51_01735 [Pseudomonadota bacterium]|nr:hypothetical protein [Pseudomonadota bacterium]
MILRRVIAHVRKQEWTAIALDFLIVVFGVFFGIQVSNWNASRLDAQRSQGYLARIHADLTADIGALERRLVFWTQVIGHGQGAIRYAETGKLVEGSAWKTVLSFYQASQMFSRVKIDTTYQELRNAGELGLIETPALRTKLAEYYVGGTGSQANYLIAMQPEYRKLVRGLTPSVASAQVWAQCHKAPSIDAQYLLDCESPMAEADAQKVLDAYMANPQLLSELRFWTTNLEVSMTLIRLNLKAARELAARLRSDDSP